MAQVPEESRGPFPSGRGSFLWTVSEVSCPGFCLNFTLDALWLRMFLSGDWLPNSVVFFPYMWMILMHKLSPAVSHPAWG